jgi:hypothetical protein
MLDFLNQVPVRPLPQYNKIGSFGLFRETDNDLISHFEERANGHQAPLFKIGMAHAAISYFIYFNKYSDPPVNSTQIIQQKNEEEEEVKNNSPKKLEKENSKESVDNAHNP